MRAYRPSSFNHSEPDIVSHRQDAKKANIARYISRQKAGLPLFDDPVKPSRRLKSAFSKH